MSIWLQKSASIQKRTSPLKFDHFRLKIPDFFDRIFQQSRGPERAGRALLRAARGDGARHAGIAGRGPRGSLREPGAAGLNTLRFTVKKSTVFSYLGAKALKNHRTPEWCEDKKR